MAVVSFNCLVYGDKPAFNHIFQMRILPDKMIGQLREEIWDRKKAWHLAHNPLLTPDDLVLYTPTKAISTAEEESFEREIAQLSFDTQEGQAPVKKLNTTFTIARSHLSQPAEEYLHIIVVVPIKSVGKRKHMDSDDAGRLIERWRSKRIKSELPTIAELARVVDLPLSDNEKIPISAEDMQDLVSPRSELYDICRSEDVELLFRIGEGGPLSYEIFSIVRHPPPVGGTENSFISFWDTNIRRILEMLIPHGKSTRNSSQHTATGNLRPDYGFLLRKLCPFRGEEKAPDSTANPKAELADKLVWAYSPAPYVLGYYATGPDLTLVAISPTERNHPAVHDIAYANLRFRSDRIKNIRRLINLAGLLQSLADLVRPSDAEFEVLERDNCTVEIAGHCVIKVFTSPERVTHLRNMYFLLGNKRVPHVDSLTHHFDTTVVLSPRGIAEPPKTEQELLAALTCVLEALEVLHKAPPIYHRDIRWPNVMRRLDDPQRWFIIDWDDAAAPPTTAQSHFNRRTHSPGVFTDGHGAEVDMWSVGELVLQCGALGVSLELHNLGKWMQGSPAPSAQEALAKIKDYQLSRVQ